MPFTASKIAAPTSPAFLDVLSGVVAGGVSTTSFMIPIHSRTGSLATAVAGARSAVVKTNEAMRGTIGPPVGALGAKDRRVSLRRAGGSSDIKRPRGECRSERATSYTFPNDCQQYGGSYSFWVLRGSTRFYE